MEEQRQMFKVLDRNGDGMLSRDELEEAFAEHGINVKVEEMDELMRNTDMSGDQSSDNPLTLSEWIAATISKQVFLKPELLRQTFKYFDRDGKGKITVDDLG